MPRKLRSSVGTRLEELELDRSCSNRTHWRTSVVSPGDRGPAPELVARAEARLEAEGWHVRCRHPRLRVFRRPGGDEIAWVLPSGRVQIRVPLGLDLDLRPGSARRIYRQLGASLAT